VNSNNLLTANYRGRRVGDITTASYWDKGIGIAEPVRKGS